MSQSMLSGVTGLMAHQRKLDVVANNLANLNTAGYKSQRILFSDLGYANLRPAGTSNNSLVGGTNPQQTGFGVGISQIARNHSQGILTVTGGIFDFALEGEGFFITSNGEPRFTRTGAFALDGRGFLVDPSNGAFVQRLGSAGEGTDGNPAFQTQGNSAIRVPLGAAIAGRSTTEAAFFGNFPSSATPPDYEILASFRPFQMAGVPATTATALNDLDSNLSKYESGDQIRLQGFDFYGNPIDATLSVDDTTTVGDLIDFYNSVLVDAQAQLRADGTLEVRADNTGPSKQRLELSDAPTNAGFTQMSNHVLVEQVKGKSADSFTTTLQVFDSRGQASTLNATFYKMDFNSWDAEFQLANNHGTMVDHLVQRIEFSETGQFVGVRGVGIGDTNIEIQFDSLTHSQRITLDFSGMTHLARGFSSTNDQNGYPPGNLVSVAVTAEGLLEGIATNGKRVPIAQLAIANFANPLGLEAAGQNYFRESGNSGAAQIGPGLAGQAGIVRGGQLETSNVDVAMEFTQMIVAQRGFSANARTITVASDVLQELVNLLR